MAVLQSYSEPVRDTERLFEVFLRDQDGEIFREEIVSCDPKEERGAIELRAAEERADKYGVTVDWYMIAGSSDITHVPEKIRSLYDEKFDGSHEIHFDWKGKEFTILSANESMVRIKSPAGKISEIPRVSFMEEISVAENAKNAPKAKKDPQMNEVSCGECGKKFKHEVGYEGDLKCPHCGYEDEQCYFPDSDATECRICGNLVSDFQSESGDLCRDCASSNSPETQKNESGTTSQFTIDDIQWGETKNMSGRADWTYLTFKCGNVWWVADLDWNGYANVYPFTTIDEFLLSEENRGEGYGSFETEEDADKHIVKLANEGLKMPEKTDTGSSVKPEDVSTSEGDLDSMLGELDNAIEEHKDTEQSETEKICIGVANQANEFMETIDADIKTAHDSLVSMMQKNQTLASVLVEGLGWFPHAKKAALYREAKKVHDSYTASLPSDTKLDFDGVFKDAVLKAMDAQKLSARTFIKSSYEFSMIGSEYARDWLRLEDVDTWFNKYNDDGPSERYRTLPQENDFRWLKLKFDNKLILEWCREKYGSLEDIRERANDSFMEKFVEDYTDLRSSLNKWHPSLWELHRTLKEVIDDDVRFKEILKEHLLSTFVKGSTLVTTTYVSKNYDGVAYIDMSRGNAPSMLSDVNRVYRASVNGCRISEIPATSVEPALWRKFSGTWNLDYPFGTTVEAEHPIKDWCESYVIYKNGNVKIRLKSGVAEKLLAYIFEYVVKVAKDRISNNR